MTLLSWRYLWTGKSLLRFAIVSAVMVGGLFQWPALWYGTGYQTVWEMRPSAETPSSVHWRRFYFQLTRVHSSLELFRRCAPQIYLLTYFWKSSRIGNPDTDCRVDIDSGFGPVSPWQKSVLSDCFCCFTSTVPWCIATGICVPLWTVNVIACYSRCEFLGCMSFAVQEVYQRRQVSSFVA